MDAMHPEVACKYATVPIATPIQAQPGLFWANRHQTDFWKRYFDRLVLMDPSLANAFSNSAVHWYQGADGETNACFVFQGSDRTNATVRLTPDHSAIEASIHGIPFGLDRSPWKKC